MSEYLKIAVVLIMAIPFAYMIFDVVRDLLKTTYKVLTEKAKPAVVQVLTSLFN